MCGLVGMAGNLNHKTNKMFRDMLFFDQVRGIDSTGIAVKPMQDKEEILILKEVGFIDNLTWKDYDNVLDRKHVLNRIPRAVIGHNRAATVGSVSAETAHPFMFDHITGAHNGTLWDYEQLVGYKKYPTDSQCIFKSIAEKDIQWTWKNFFGDAAIVYWNEVDSTINFVRNSGRPLHYAFSENRDILFWASEAWMITISASRLGIKLYKEKDETSSTIKVSEDYLYTWKVSNTNVRLIKKEKLESFKYVSNDYSKYYNEHNQYQPNINNNNKGWWTEGVTNQGWGKGWKKLPKDSVGLQFTLSGEYFSTNKNTNHIEECMLVGDIVGDEYPNHTVQVIPQSLQEYTNLTKYTTNKVIFTSNCRGRVQEVEKNGKKSFIIRVPSSYIELTKILSTPNTNSNDQKVVDLYKTYSYTTEQGITMHLDEKTWLNLMHKRCDNSCSYCGQPFEIKDASSIIYLGVNNDPICSICNEDPTFSYYQDYSIMH